MITVYLACGGLIFTALLGFVLFIAHYLTFSGYLAFIFLGTFLAALTPPFVWLLLGLFFGSAIFIHAIKKVASNQFDTIGKKEPSEMLNSFWLIACPFLLLAY